MPSAKQKGKPSMPAPKAPVICDVPGCGLLSALTTDGTEVDVQGLERPALPNINVCARHANWPHSDDAKVFALMSGSYKQRA